MTLEEALLEMEDGRDYVAYRDADKQAVCMLIRRRDGHYRSNRNLGAGFRPRRRLLDGPVSAAKR